MTPRGKKNWRLKITAAVERIVTEILAVCLQMILDAHSTQCEYVSVSIKHHVLYQ
jgi:hypothetical protein